MKMKRYEVAKTWQYETYELAMVIAAAFYETFGVFPCVEELTYDMPDDEEEVIHRGLDG